MDLTKQKRRPDNEIIQLMEEFESSDSITMYLGCTPGNLWFYNGCIFGGAH
jgi:hypothetical protein